MRNRMIKTLALVGIALMLVLAGCGDDDDSSEGSSESVELPAGAADVVAGGGDTYIVSRPNAASSGACDSTGFSVLWVVESDGEWLVAAHRFTGDWPHGVSAAGQAPH